MPTRAIKAIFFTRFHHEKGSRVLHQVPEGSITPSRTPSALASPLINFESVTTYLIPTQQFCDRLLTFCTNKYRVIGYPVCIREGKYSRNEFIFNFALVVEEGVADWVAFGEVVGKLGRLLRGLEEQGGFLSGEEDIMGVWEDDAGLSGYRMDDAEDGGRLGGESKVYALCEMVLEDLNNYAECMIPIDDSNTINLKLFPTRPPPPPIHAHTVPLLTISLSTLSNPISSDLTLSRILPYINGINSVSHIAQLADTDLSLTRKAIQHLVYYNCLVLLDIFNFGAVYAPTAEIGGFIVDEGVKEECRRYVAVPRIHWGSKSSNAKMGSESDHDQSTDSRASVSSAASQASSTHTAHSLHPYAADATVSSPDVHPITHENLITLYTSLRQGLTLRNWVLNNLSLLAGIDIRRLITFGIIKGFLYRVHKYAIATSLNVNMNLPPAPPTSLQSATPTPSTTTPTFNHAHKDSDTSTIKGHLSTLQGQTVPQPPNHLHHKPSLASTANLFAPGDRRIDDVARLDSLVSDGAEAGLPLVRFLDGMHCFDEICTELGLSEKAVEAKIKGVGEVQVFSR